MSTFNSKQFGVAVFGEGDGSTADAGSRFTFNGAGFVFGGRIFGGPGVHYSKYTFNGFLFGRYPFNGPTVPDAGPSAVDDRILYVSWIDDRVITLEDIAMTEIGVRIEDIVIGDDRRIRRVYKVDGVSEIVAIARLVIKKRDKEADASGLFNLSITTTGSDHGQITQANFTSGSISLYFNLEKVKTALARPNLKYVYDVAIEMQGGEIHTLEKGTISYIL